MPVDLAGHLCEAFRVEDASEQVPRKVHRWLQELGLAKRSDERLLVYVSSGGTCRDPMAKAITEDLLQQHDLACRIRVMACGLHVSSQPRASFAAAEAIRRVYGRDLLADHVPIPLTETIKEEADIILVMDKTLRVAKATGSEKTFVFKPFFGYTGDIVDPYSNRSDETTIAKYLACCLELKEILETNFEQLVHRLLAARSLS